MITADAAATLEWTQAARDAFARVDQVLAENSEALRDTIQNMQKFADALGSNAERVDKIAAGLERMTGASGPGVNATIYDLMAPTVLGSDLKIPATTLVVVTPTSAVTTDTQRFLVGTAGAEVLAFDDAKWRDNIPALIQAKIIQSFENAGYRRVGTDTQGLLADRQLLIDIRAFRVTTADEPEGEIDIAAKVVGSDGQILASRNFEAKSAVAGAIGAGPAAAALNQAFQQLATALVPWVLAIP
jgi:phospholipid/cholesterol/gamma-HCH transport system substrate-binding protein